MSHIDEKARSLKDFANELLKKSQENDFLKSRESEDLIDQLSQITSLGYNEDLDMMGDSDDVLEGISNTGEEDILEPAIDLNQEETGMEALNSLFSGDDEDSEEEIDLDLAPVDQEDEKVHVDVNVDDTQDEEEEKHKNKHLMV